MQFVILNFFLSCVKFLHLILAGLELLRVAIENAGYTDKIQIGMDVAASEFCKEKLYDLDFKNPNSDKSKWVSFQHGSLDETFSVFRLNSVF